MEAKNLICVHIMLHRIVHLSPSPIHQRPSAVCYRVGSGDTKKECSGACKDWDGESGAESVEFQIYFYTKRVHDG